MAKSITTKTSTKATGKASAAGKASKTLTELRVVSRSSLKPGTLGGQLVAAPDAFSAHEYRSKPLSTEVKATPITVVVHVPGSLTKTRKADLMRRAKEAFGAETTVVVQLTSEVVSAAVKPKPAPEVSMDEAFAALESVSTKFKSRAKQAGMNTSPAGIDALIKQVRAERRAHPTPTKQASATGRR